MSMNNTTKENTIMENEKHKVRLEVDLRDVRLFAECLHDRRSLESKLNRDASDVWSFEGNHDDAEELANELLELHEELGGLNFWVYLDDEEQNF